MYPKTHFENKTLKKKEIIVVLSKNHFAFVPRNKRKWTFVYKFAKFSALKLFNSKEDAYR